MEWPDRPRIDPGVESHWNQLIQDWITDRTIPLIVRKSSHEKVCYWVDHPERRIAPSDNSPAHWVAIQCFNGTKPSIEEIRAAMTAGQIPMTMVLSKVEIARNPPFPVPLARLAHAGKNGWYLAHRKPVATGIPARLEDAKIEAVVEHFRRLMSPSNFILIPKQIAGMSDLDFFFEGEDS
jgi:hypothetical protein